MILYKQPKLRYILTNNNYNLDTKLLDTFLKECPKSVNYYENKSEISRYHTPKIHVLDVTNRLTNTDDLKHHLDIPNASHMCLIELSESQNNMLCDLVKNDDLLDKARFKVSKHFKAVNVDEKFKTEYVQSELDDESSSCIIL